MAWDVMSRVTKMAWDVMSGVTKTAWDVLSGVANLCGMFCPGCKKMAWDVLSRDVLSGSHLSDVIFIARGIADFLFSKAVPNEKRIPTCRPQCYDVEKMLILFILGTSKYLLW